MGLVRVQSPDLSCRKWANTHASSGQELTVQDCRTVCGESVVGFVVVVVVVDYGLLIVFMGSADVAVWSSDTRMLEDFHPVGRVLFTALPVRDCAHRYTYCSLGFIESLTFSVYSPASTNTAPSDCESPFLLLSNLSGKKKSTRGDFLTSSCLVLYLWCIHAATDLLLLFKVQTCTSLLKLLRIIRQDGPELAR